MAILMGHADATAQACSRKEPDDPILFSDLCHSHDAIALHRGIAGKVGDAVVRNPQTSWNGLCHIYLLSRAPRGTRAKDKSC